MGISLGENCALATNQSVDCHATILFTISLQRCETGDSIGLYTTAACCVFCSRSGLFFTNSLEISFVVQKPLQDNGINTTIKISHCDGKLDLPCGPKNEWKIREKFTGKCNHFLWRNYEHHQLAFFTQHSWHYYLNICLSKTCCYPFWKAENGSFIFEKKSRNFLPFTQPHSDVSLSQSESSNLVTWQ